MIKFKTLVLIFILWVVATTSVIFALRPNKNIFISNNKISEAFFAEHLDKISWQNLSQNTNISEDFFTQHLEKLDWDDLSANTNISEEFFTKHTGKLQWKLISLNSMNKYQNRRAACDQVAVPDSLRSSTPPCCG